MGEIVVNGICRDLVLRVSVGQETVRIDPRYFRSSEVETLVGDSTRAKSELGWKLQITFNSFELSNRFCNSSIRFFMYIKTNYRTPLYKFYR